CAYLPALGSAAEDPNRRGRLPQLRADRMSQHVRVPSYRLHKQSGQAVVTLSDGTGGRRDVLLGKYGSPKSRADYTRVGSEWEAAGCRLWHTPSPGASLTIDEVVTAFWDYAEQHYRLADSTPSKELVDFRLSLRPLRHLYGHTPAGTFGPLALKTV